MKKIFVGARVAAQVASRLSSPVATALLVAAAVLVLALAGCGSAAPAAKMDGASGGMTLDEAIAQAAAQIEAKLAKGTEVALINVSSPSAAFSDYVLSGLEAALVNSGKLVVVDRANLDKIREEQGFQASGEVSDASAKSIGQMLGAGAIVTGSLANIGSSYRLTLKAINVEKATVAASVPADIRNDERVQALIGQSSVAGLPRSSAAQNSTPEKAPAQPAAAATPAAPAGGYKVGGKGPAGGFVFYDNAPVSEAAPPRAPLTQTYTVGQRGQAGGTTFYDSQPAAVPASLTVKSTATYKVGDKGPAGGIIFYVNPVADDNWRYLEAAPASTEGKDIKWAVNRGSVSGTKVEIGTGKKNTQLIVDFSLQTGENMPAARLCDRLVSGGYDDWFLPSKLELGLMFLNLKDAGIGGFSEQSYWSSSESGDHNGVWAQAFSNGWQNGSGDSYFEYLGRKGDGHSVRAIRQF